MQPDDLKGIGATSGLRIGTKVILIISENFYD